MRKTLSALLAAVIFAGSSLLSPCGMSALQLGESLVEPMDAYAGYFLEAEKESGVNAVFLASVAALESGWGSSKAAKERNNLFGWSNPDGSLTRFNSVQECISHVSNKLSENYLREDGLYFNGCTVEGIGKRYCETDAWADAVKELMIYIGGEDYADQK